MIDIRNVRIRRRNRDFSVEFVRRRRRMRTVSKWIYLNVLRSKFFLVKECLLFFPSASPMRSSRKDAEELMCFTWGLYFFLNNFLFNKKNNLFSKDDLSERKKREGEVLIKSKEKRGKFSSTCSERLNYLFYLVMFRTKVEIFNWR